jgi:hypothetical protein
VRKIEPRPYADIVPTIVGQTIDASRNPGSRSDDTKRPDPGRVTLEAEPCIPKDHRSRDGSSSGLLRLEPHTQPDLVARRLEHYQTLRSNGRFAPGAVPRAKPVLDP